jgi:hypothetical protein
MIVNVILALRGTDGNSATKPAASSASMGSALEPQTTSASATSAGLGPTVVKTVAAMGTVGALRVWAAVMSASTSRGGRGAKTARREALVMQRKPLASRVSATGMLDLAIPQRANATANISPKGTTVRYARKVSMGIPGIMELACFLALARLSSVK